MSLTLGEKIKRLRILKGIERYQMAEHLSLSESAYGKIERGETRIDIERLNIIAGFLGENTSAFVEPNHYNKEDSQPPIERTPVSQSDDHNNYDKLVASLSDIANQVPRLIEKQNELLAVLVNLIHVEHLRAGTPSVILPKKDNQ